MNIKTVIAGFSTAAISAVTRYLNQTNATLEKDLLEAADYEFIKFVLEHGRSYASSAEFKFGSKIFKDNFAKLETFNY